MKRKINKKPTARDLRIWKKVNLDFQNWGYEGLVGKLQILGHKTIRTWSKKISNGYCLEIGCGAGHHVDFSKPPYLNYLGLDITLKYLDFFKKHHPDKPLLQGDVFFLPFKSASIDTILSIYNLEHLKHLEESLLEVNRVLKNKGAFLVALPSEGGLLYNFGRSLTTKPYMEKKYGIDYDAIVKYEHCNNFQMIKKCLADHFTIKEISYIPFNFARSFHLNAIVCISLEKPE